MTHRKLCVMVVFDMTSSLGVTLEAFFLLAPLLFLMINSNVDRSQNLTEIQIVALLYFPFLFNLSFSCQKMSFIVCRFSLQ